MTEIKTKADYVKFTFVKFYCRSYSLPITVRCETPIMINCLSYFADCFNITDEIDRLYVEHEPRSYKSTKQMMMNYVPVTRWNKWPDKYGIENDPRAVTIISKYTRKDVNKFLDRLIDGLTPSKIYRMKGRTFRVTAGIYTELGMTVEHPLHRIIVMRQMMETGILFDSLWHLTYNFLLDTENLGNV